MKLSYISVNLLAIFSMAIASPLPDPQASESSQEPVYSLPSDVPTVQDLGIGGVGDVAGDFSSRKEAINEGVASVVGDNNRDLRALYHAAAGYETSFGQNFPTEEDQREAGKLGKDSQEIGLARINVEMLNDLGYSQNDIQTMNSQTPQGDELNAEAFARAVEKYGPDGFFHYHRGGITRYNNFLNGNLSDDEKRDTEEFRRHYEAAANQVKQDNLDSPDSQGFAFVSSGVPNI